MRATTNMGNRPVLIQRNRKRIPVMKRWRTTIPRDQYRLAAVVASAAVIAAAASGCTAAASQSATAKLEDAGHATVDSAHGTICLLWPNETTPAWTSYQIPTAVAAFKKYMPNMKLLQYNGNSDAGTQLGQVQACIADKATAVVISPTVPEEAGAELKDLAAAHIPAIALDQDPDGGPAYAYVWVNFGYAGQWFGKEMTANLVKQVGHKPVRLAEIYGDPTFAVYHDWLTGIDPYLNALIKKGDVKVVCQANTPSWDPATAQTNMEQCLTKTGNDVDAVLAMNDSTSDGIAAALQQQHLLGKVKIYGGHDGDLTTVQRVLAGDQIATFHPDDAAQAVDAVILVEAALAGKTAQSTGLIDYHFMNGYTKGGVPTVKSPEILVTAKNVQQTIVDTGMATKAEICTSIAVNTAFCKD
jgi:D-xylose transport system substrate-binding protein